MMIEMTTAYDPLLRTLERSDEQRLEALDQANRVRSARALLKRTIARDPEDARRVVMNPTPDYRTMLLRDVLLAIPKMGPMKVDGAMWRAGIYHRKTLAGLTTRQREAALTIITDAIRRLREDA